MVQHTTAGYRLTWPPSRHMQTVAACSPAKGEQHALSRNHVLWSLRLRSHCSQLHSSCGTIQSPHYQMCKPQELVLLRSGQLGKQITAASNNFGTSCQPQPAQYWGLDKGSQSNPEAINACTPHPAAAPSIHGCLVGFKPSIKTCFVGMNLPQRHMHMPL